MTPLMMFLPQNIHSLIENKPWHTDLEYFLQSFSLWNAICLLLCDSHRTYSAWF